MDAPPLQLTARGPVLGHPSGVPALANLFREQQVIKLPGFIAPPLLSWIHGQVAAASWFERQHEGLAATELSMHDNTCLGLLHFLVNDPVVLRFVEEVVSHQPLTAFNGRVYHRMPGRHRDDWHDDLHPDRQVGLSVNLSAGVHEGGVFELRLADGERPLGAMANVGFGDAILFAIADHLQHRVSPLGGTVAKTAFAGWFGGTRDYNRTLRSDPTLADP